MRRLCLLSPLLLLLALPAWAVLGEAAQSIQKDQSRLQGTLRIKRARAYTLHQIQAPYGTVVREYVAPRSGNVFAVTWNGPRIPISVSFWALISTSTRAPLRAAAATVRSSSNFPAWWCSRRDTSALLSAALTCPSRCPRACALKLCVSGGLACTNTCCFSHLLLSCPRPDAVEVQIQAPLPAIIPSPPLPPTCRRWR